MGRHAIGPVLRFDRGRGAGRCFDLDDCSKNRFVGLEPIEPNLEIDTLPDSDEFESLGSRLGAWRSNCHKGRDSPVIMSVMRHEGHGAKQEQSGKGRDKSSKSDRHGNTFELNGRRPLAEGSAVADVIRRRRSAVREGTKA
jgi:hypothetical protein